MSALQSASTVSAGSPATRLGSIDAYRGFYGLVDVWGFRRCAFPLVVIGMNSIAIYCLVHRIEGFIINSLKTCFGHGWPLVFGETFEPMMTGAAALLIFWLILYWMYRRKLFLRI